MKDLNDMKGLHEAMQAKPVPGVAPGGAAAQSPELKRPLWEILLDPRSIQWLMALGGFLLVVATVLWLWSAGFFEKPLHIAVIMGLVNGGLLAGGWTMIRYTRYQTAGRAITLLAGVIMPLNLWFYHSNQLITLEGHLWIPALIICALYAVSALALRDPLFVYMLTGGVAMTGLLILENMGHFREVAAPSTLLVVLGLICLHALWAFPVGEGPFSRQRFGTAFFWSGQALLGLGLIFLFCAQVIGWLYQPLLVRGGLRDPLHFVTQQPSQVLALALVLAGTYAYLYSDLMVRRLGEYIFGAAFTILWAEVLLVQLLNLQRTPEVIIVALALTALVINFVQARAPREGGVSRLIPSMGLPLTLLPVILGLILHLRATYQDLYQQWPFEINWAYVGAMFLTAIVSRLGAYLYKRQKAWLETTYFMATAATTMLGAAGLFSLLGLRSWAQQAPVLMLIPIAYIVAAHLWRGHSPERPLVWTAYASTAIMTLAVLASASSLTPQYVIEPLTGKALNMLLALFFFEGAAFFALAAVTRRPHPNIALGTGMAFGALWQFLSYWSLSAEYYALAASLFGLFLLITHRVALTRGEANPALQRSTFQAANALLSLSFVSVSLMMASRMATGRLHEYSLVGVLAAVMVVSLAASRLTLEPAWRRFYFTLTIIELLLTLVAMQILSRLTLWEKLELLSVITGVALLVLGHIGWYRDQSAEDDAVDFELLAGSLLVGVPLSIAVVLHRYDLAFSVINELGMLAAGILLLATGFIFKLRATTLTGSALLSLYLVTLLLFLNAITQLRTTSIWLGVAGTLIFGAGVLLSLYRDRLMTLPARIKSRDGIFRVLSWR